MIKKVYCGNCKYGTFMAICNSPKNQKDYYFGKSYDKAQYEINGDNMCKWYKKKWYLFWVK